MSNPSSTLAGSSPATTAQATGAASAAASNAIAGPSNPHPPTSGPSASAANGLPNGQLQAPTDGVKMEEGEMHSDLFAARREEDLARKDRSLAEFLKMLDGYNPLVRIASGLAVYVPCYLLALSCTDHMAHQSTSYLPHAGFRPRHTSRADYRSPTK